MGTAAKSRSWHPLARTAALAAGVLALAGCATGYSLVQPYAAASGAYYTSNGPYGGNAYYDDTGGYYTDGIGAPYYGSVGGYYGFGGFDYAYPWYGAGPTFGLGLGSLCGWSCAGFYGNPLYSIGYGYPWGWGAFGYGHRGRHHHHGHSDHDTAWDGTWHHHHHDRDGWHSWGTRQPGIAAAGQPTPAGFASRAAILPSAGFAPRHGMAGRAYATPGAARISELVGPPAVGPGIEGTAGFSRPAAMPMTRAPAMRFSPSAVPMMHSASPQGFPAPAFHAMPVAHPMPAPARGTPSIRIR